MSQPSRKRQRQQQQQQSPPAVKEEQQEEEEIHSNSIGAGISAASHCSSSNLEDSNTIGTAAAGGNDSGDADDIKEVKMKMAALEAKIQILEGKLEYQEFNARIHAKSEEGILSNLKKENRALWMRLNEVEDNSITDCKKIMDVCGRMFKALEQTHQQEMAGLSAKLVSKKQRKYAKGNQQQQQQQPNAEMPDCVCVDMPESQQQGTSNNGEQATMVPAAAALIPPPSIAPNLAESAQPQEQPQTANKKKLCNLEGNYWNVKSSRATMKVSPGDGLTAHNRSPFDWGNLYAKKGFRISGFRPDQFVAGQMLYYYEITNKSTSVSGESRFCIGLALANAMIPKNSWIGWAPNTYAMPEKCDYCLLSGTRHQFEEPNGAIVPKWNGYGDIVGCGLLLSADHKLTIFFTNNGILMGKQMPIMPLGSNLLTPTVCLNRDVTLEANFGAKPFKYNIDECPGLVFE